MNWLLKIIYNAILEGLIALLNKFKPLLSNIFKVMYDLSSTLEFDKVKEYTKSIGLTLVGVYAIKLCIDTYVLQTEGDPDADPFEMITRIAKTCAFIICGDWFIDKMLHLASLFSDEIIKSLDLEKRDIIDMSMNELSKMSNYNDAAIFIILILMVVCLITYTIVSFKAAKRAVDIVLFNVALPIVALDNLTTNREKFNSFFQDLFVCSFGYIIQNFCICVFFNVFAEALRNNLNVGYMVLGIAWLMTVFKARYLEKWTYSSGIGNAVKAGLRSMTYTIPNIVRSIKK